MASSLDADRSPDFSSRMVLAPASAASEAAVVPAAPPPPTKTSQVNVELGVSGSASLGAQPASPAPKSAREVSPIKLRRERVGDVFMVNLLTFASCASWERDVMW